MAILRVAFIALVGAVIFQALSLPIPWMLGPLFTVLLSQFLLKQSLQWSPKFRNAGLIILGVAIGNAFDLTLFKNIGPVLIYMFLITVVLIIFCLGIAFLLHKTIGLPLKTAVTSSVPGGLSQLILFAEEEKDVDIATVTFYHVVRVIAVVMFVPFIISGEVVKEVSTTFEGSWLVLIGIVILATGSVFVGKKIYLPVPQFLSPILLVIILKVFTVEVPELPASLLHIAQLFIGAYIGLLLKPKMLKLPWKVLIGGIASTLAMIALTYGSSIIIANVLNLSFETSFLSTAPGGLDQMGILAAAVGADISVVTIFQLFRLLFIFFIVLPLMKWFYRKAIK